jgi:hypothetical protein
MRTRNSQPSVSLGVISVRPKKPSKQRNYVTQRSSGIECGCACAQVYSQHEAHSRKVIWRGTVVKIMLSRDYIAGPNLPSTYQAFSKLATIILLMLSIVHITLANSISKAYFAGQKHGSVHKSATCLSTYQTLSCCPPPLGAIISPSRKS